MQYAEQCIGIFCNFAMFFGNVNQNKLIIKLLERISYTR
ncbi:hypothetical protein SAMN05216383_105157 [Prevotella sp. KH2C16]|nr:hypothetical protein SAMN05216383_105157 [Prevotella sp. KH2C16]